mgnify:CR=1 FL=1
MILAEPISLNRELAKPAVDLAGQNAVGTIAQSPRPNLGTLCALEDAEALFDLGREAQRAHARGDDEGEKLARERAQRIMDHIAAVLRQAGYEDYEARDVLNS